MMRRYHRTCMMRRLSERCSSESFASLRRSESTVFSRYPRCRAASRSRSLSSSCSPAHAKSVMRMPRVIVVLLVLACACHEAYRRHAFQAFSWEQRAGPRTSVMMGCVQRGRVGATDRAGQSARTLCAFLFSVEMGGANAAPPMRACRSAHSCLPLCARAPAALRTRGAGAAGSTARCMSKAPRQCPTHRRGRSGAWGHGCFAMWQPQRRKQMCHRCASPTGAHARSHTHTHTHTPRLQGAEFAGGGRGVAR